MNRELVLVVESVSTVREQVSQLLSKKFEVITAHCGVKGSEFAYKFKPQVIILELAYPEIDAIEVCRRLRSDPMIHNCRFIFVANVSDALKRIEAFNAGADDYIERPFGTEELVARVKSKMRRVREDTTQAQRVLADIVLDLSKMSLVIKGGAPVKLGVTEAKIFNALLNAEGRVLPRKQLSKEVWGEGADRVVDPHITSLRKKLAGANVEIKTVYGEGYCVVVTEN